ncbi:hypothetical protein [Nocardia sp. NPDC005978]|uniref:hypothetical protein n=1 Tax=unclassified Nocardia TaxID=2637762 RepID=UPI0033B9ABDE
MFDTKYALLAIAAATAATVCATPAHAGPESEFITLNAAVTTAPGGLQATGTYRCEAGIGYLDVKAAIDTTGSGTIQLASTPPGITLPCTDRTETWTATLTPTNNLPVLVPYTDGTGTAQLNRKYWKVGSGEVLLHFG